MRTTWKRAVVCTQKTWIVRGARALALGHFVALLVSSPALAQTARGKADAETTAAARAVAIEGVKLARAGYCPQAIAQLERAEALHHSSIVLAELGECYLRVGRVVAASEALRSVTREPLSEPPTPAQLTAHARAEVLLSDALARSAQLTIDVRGRQLRDVSLSIDGHAVSPALIGVARPTDPGVHRVLVSAPGFLSDSAEVTLAAGEAQSLTLSLEAAPAPAKQSVRGPRAAGAQARPAPERAPAQQPESNRALRAGYGLLGVGALGIALGAGFGGAALRSKLRLDDRCAADSCPAAAGAELAHAKDWALASTVSFALGGLSAAIGAILVAIEKRERPRNLAAWSVDAGPGIGLATRARF